MLFENNSGKDQVLRPHFSMWLGNFFDPYYDDYEIAKKAVLDIKEMGMNAIALDSKLWADFVRYYEGKESSQYVRMQLFIAKECEKNKIGLHFLALFNKGDNLYPVIRDEPPVFVDQPVDKDGNLVTGYRHWSVNQMDKQVEHCMNLYKFIAKDAACIAKDDKGNIKKTFYFYHSPCFYQSFDKDGEDRYVDYLRKKYSNIEELNKEYEADFESFDSITLNDVWYDPKAEDYLNPSFKLKVFRDNQLYRIETMDEYMGELTKKIRKEDPRFYLHGCMTQWKYLMINNIFINKRGVDLWKMGKWLDCPTFFTMPSDSFGRSNIYTVSSEMAILRSACRSKHLVGGLFVGRYVFEDIYKTYSISETIATAYGAGCKDLSFYGYSGLDDGGNFGKLDSVRKEDTKRGLDWFSEVRKISGERLEEKKAAIIFPEAGFTMLDESVIPKEDRRFANDLLGWYEQLANCGINPDVLSYSQAISKASLYEIIILPSDPLYDYMPSSKLEDAIYKAIESGVTCYVSASSYKHHVFKVDYVIEANNGLFEATYYLNVEQRD